jgi:HEAT repeat protein
MRRCALLALTASLLVHPMGMMAQQDLDIGMKMTKTAAMLGEPVWIDVTVTNRSGRAIYLDFGSECWGNKPLKVSLPDAESTVKPAARCGAGMGGSCGSGALPSLADGETMTRSYVLDGNFHIVRPGSYEALLEKTIRYAPVSSNRSDLQLTASLEKQQTAKSTVVLQVDAPDSAKLLALEQEYARTAMEKPGEPKFPTSPPDGKPMDITAVRLALARRNSEQMEASLRRYAIVEGLSVYPVAGMEAVFHDWVESHQYNAYGLMALKRLNTPAAREALADIASSQAHLQDTWIESFRWQAVDALADLGDKKYSPLLEGLVRDSNVSVHNTALQDLGRLGGEAELNLLAGVARNGRTSEDRREAISAMGDTASLKAVPLLIEFADIADADELAATYIALQELTHLDFPSPAHRPALDVKKAWQQYWNEHRRTARSYGPYECSSPPFNPYLGLGGMQ